MGIVWVWWNANAWAQTAPGSDAQDWQLPAAILAAGLVAALALGATLRRADPSVAEQAKRADLVSTHASVVEALRHLDVEASKMTKEAYQQERAALLARGAAALEALEEPTQDLARETPVSDAEPPRTPAPKPLLAPEWKGALSALAVVAVIGGMWWFAQDSATIRPEGGSMTGNNAGAVLADVKAKAEAALAIDPTDLGALNDLTEVALNEGDATRALTHNSAALEAHPNDHDARSYRAVLAAMMGMIDHAHQGFDEVLADNPAHERSLTYKGLLLLQAGDADGAVGLFERALAVNPGNSGLRQVLAQAKAQQNAEPLVSGTATLADGTTLPEGALVFVSIKDPTRPGPPIAARRVTPRSFPLEIALTTADIRSMPGAPTNVPDTFELSVRVDLDGNAMTKEDAPQRVVPDVAKGTSGLQIVLE